MKNDYETAQSVYSANYHIDDFELIDVVWATYISANRPGLPLWLRIKGPPSFTKTTTTDGMSTMKSTLLVSGLTDNTLFTGMKGAKPLAPLLNGKVMIMNDASSLQSLNADKRAKIYSQLRDLYDGDYAHYFGGEIPFNIGHSRFGMIWACTRAIEDDAMFNQRLGERFLDVCVRNEHRVEKTRQSIANLSTINAVKDTIRKSTNAFLEPLWKTPTPISPATTDQINEVISLSDFVSRAMTPCVRERTGKQDIVQIPEPNGPMRLGAQLLRLGSSLAEVRGVSSIGEKEIDTIKRVAIDGIQLERRRILDIVKNHPIIRNGTIANNLGLSRAVVQRKVSELVLLKLLDADADGKVKFGTQLINPTNTSNDEREKFTYTLSDISKRTLVCNEDGVQQHLEIVDRSEVEDDIDGKN